MDGEPVPSGPLILQRQVSQWVIFGDYQQRTYVGLILPKFTHGAVVLNAFLKVTGKPKSDFQAQLANWNAGAIAMFLAEFAYQESHDTSLSAAVETAIHDDNNNVADIDLSKFDAEIGKADSGKIDMGRVQRSLNEMPGTAAVNEAINML